MREEVNTAFLNILNTMAGADGPVRFLKFKFFIENFDDLASKGDDEAEKIVTVMRQFSKMIDIANREG